MENRHIITLIQNAQMGNIESLEEITKIFLPLCNKYAYLLQYDDAANDLIIFLLKLVKNPVLK